MFAVSGRWSGRTWREVLQEASTFWHLTAGLLEIWRAGNPSSCPERAADETYESWASDVAEVVELFGEVRDADEVRDEDRHALGRLLSAPARSEPDTVHAVAWGISVALNETFAPAWRDDLGAAPHQLSVGEPYPVADPSWTPTGGRQLTSRPDSMTSPAVGELPFVRVHDGSFEVSVDHRLAPHLEIIASQLPSAVAGHPNQCWDEYAFNTSSKSLIFPIQPRDPDSQQERIEQIIELAAERSSALVVLPELCLTPEISAAVADLVYDLPDPQLVVAGSFHADAGEGPVNVAVGLMAGTRRQLQHSKNVPFTDEVGMRRPSKEGIRSQEPLRLTIYPADRFRFALAICRELLDENVRRIYDRMAVNVLAVPALSAKTTGFRDAVAARVAQSQAVTIVVNGPLEDQAGQPLRPAVVLGQPIVGHSVLDIDVSGQVGITEIDIPLAP